MKRVFLSFNEYKCTNQCRYCFDNWDIEKNNFDILEDYHEDVVIYPYCNNDIIDSSETLTYLKECISIQSGDRVIISISTKNDLSSNFLEQIKGINNKGFVKISVSLTNKNMIDKIENKAASYSTRLDLLKKLKALGIPTSVILKPILPFISLEEYYEIIEDVKDFVENFVLGDLYVKENDDFYKSYIHDKYNINKRNVSWLKNEPSWLIVESLEKRTKIQEYLKEKGIEFYLSDIDHINKIERNI